MTLRDAQAKQGAHTAPQGPVEEGRADDNMSDRLFMSPRSDLDPGSHRCEGRWLMRRARSTADGWSSKLHLIPPRLPLLEALARVTAHTASIRQHDPCDASHTVRVMSDAIELL